VIKKKSPLKGRKWPEEQKARHMETRRRNALLKVTAEGSPQVPDAIGYLNSARVWLKGRELDKAHHLMMLALDALLGK